MKRNTGKQHWFGAAAVPLALALALIPGAWITAAAQEERLPSVSDYRLPDPASRPSSRPQGPIDRDNPVVLRPTREPATAEPGAAPEAPAPAPSASAAAASPAEATTPRPAGASAASAVNRRPAVAPTAASGAPSRPQAPLGAAPDASAPATGETAQQPTDPAAADPATAVPPIAWNVHSAAGDKSSAMWPWLAGIAALLASNALLLFMLLRRRQARAAAANEAAEYEAAQAAQAPREAIEPVPSEPSPAPMAERDPELDLMTLLAEPEFENQAAAAPAVSAPAPRPTLDVIVNPLEVTLAARRLSATLMNTVLNYELVIANNSGSPIGPISVAGDMIGAHASLPTRSQLEMGGNDIAPQHRIQVLGPGESTTVSGELRLPLAAITPIRSGNASLFVPLARFRAEALRNGAPPLVINRTFVIGESQDRPGAALKPFRLDLGPRLYSHIGQREVAATA